MSKQRQVVYEVVKQSCDHPTAEVVLLRCKAIMPSINIATVYRNLNALVEEGLVKKIVAQGGDRFDKTLHSHAHYQCKNCGKVIDVSDKLLDAVYSFTAFDGGSVDEITLSVKGLCNNCR